MNSLLIFFVHKNLLEISKKPVYNKHDALTERLQSVHETTSLLYDRMMENVEYGRQRLKDIVEKEAEEEQQQNDEQYDMVAKIKLV